MGVIALAFAGVTFYLMHLFFWDSFIYVFYAIPCVIMAFLSLCGCMVYYNLIELPVKARVLVDVIVPFLIVGGIPLDIGIERLSYQNYVSFTPEKWKTIEDAYKCDMALDFLGKYEVVGMTMNEIVSLLDEPQREGPLESSNRDYTYYYDYSCGSPKTGLGIDSYLLTFYTMGESRDLVVVNYVLTAY